MWLGESEKVASKWADHYFFLFCRHVLSQSAKGGMHDRGNHFCTFFLRNFLGGRDACPFSERVTRGGKRFDFSYTLPFPYLAIGIFPYFFSIFSPNGFFSPFRSSSPHDSNKLRERERRRWFIMFHHGVRNSPTKFRLQNEQKSFENRAHANMGNRKKLYIWHFANSKELLSKSIHPPLEWVWLSWLSEESTSVCDPSPPLPLLPKRIMFPGKFTANPPYPSWEERKARELSWHFLVCAEPKRRGGKGWWVDN